MGHGLYTLVLGSWLSKALFWDVNVSQSLASVRPYLLVPFEGLTHDIDNER
jgi:hypothetical protein